MKQQHWYNSLIIVALLASLFSFTSAGDEAEAYYIYSDLFEHGIPSGFMGDKDGSSLKVDVACKIEPYKGNSCARFTANNSETWRGIHIQLLGAWNAALKSDAKLADLSTYDKLEFYARAEETENGPYLLQTIGVGGGGAPEDQVEDSYLEIGTQWKKFSISLKGHDFKRVNTMLYLVLPVGTLYLDEIRFVKKINK